MKHLGLKALALSATLLSAPRVWAADITIVLGAEPTSLDPHAV